ncbi:hypothetical protein NEIMUCOT_04826 [Neisseria mucosa ATCC 25996]|uniref:Uncharacterized protein n=1 Tax=Neisseria mucosa (strain ATCC 25996 / DSM 4631 / NCTC 10774 / M26) TaxID=546266 RepID=D2ZW33_NEIM2|nr:hypothetical protein NEIMUCOT_04826 [Neisseria mucosa ATCC 25996]
MKILHGKIPCAISEAFGIADKRLPKPPVALYALSLRKTAEQKPAARFIEALKYPYH